MSALKTTSARAAAACLFFSLFAIPISAQQSATTDTQNTQDQLTAVRVKNSFVIAPDFKITEVDGHFAKLAGVYGGLVNDNTLLVGAGGYWLTNRSDDQRMAYGGLVVEWRVGANRRLGFSGKGLVGLGEATLATNLDGFSRTLPEGDRQARSRPTLSLGASGRSVVRSARFMFHDQFFVAEPQASLVFKVTNWLRLNSGVGYRVIGGAGGVEDRLRGTTGSFALQFGGGS
jgi:hypothetical protein